MAFNVKDPETDLLVRELARRTGEGLTGAIKSAVREKLDRMPADADDEAERMAKIRALLAKADALPVYDDRPADEIIGYNEYGRFD